MKQPPKMLTPKDCLYLEDLMNVTLTLSKKSKFYATLIKEKQIQSLIKSIERKLNSEYNKLLEIIKGQ